MDEPTVAVPPPSRGWPPEPPLGDKLDINAVIAWLLRSWRETAQVSLRTVEARTAGSENSPSFATLSRRESDGRRDSTIMAAYEAALGLSYGAIRTPVDIVCRTFAYAPVDRGPYRPMHTYDTFDRVCQSVYGDSATGSDWLRFAEHHNDPARSWGLPAFEIRRYLDKLVDELRRSLGAAYVLRYEALASLRCGVHHDAVLSAIRDAVTEPGAQLLNDIMSAASENPNPELLAWCADLLADESWPLVSSATVAIQNMLEVDNDLGEEDWDVLVGPFARAIDAASDPAYLRTLANTLATLPTRIREKVMAEAPRTLPPVRRPNSWDHDRSNAHFAHAEKIASSLRDGGADDPILKRLIFDLLFDHRAARSCAAMFLLRASPYVEALRDELTTVAFKAGDRNARHGATSALSMLLDDPVPDHLPWLAFPDPVHHGMGLEICAWSERRLPSEAMLRLVRQGDDQLARHALFAAGMARHPVLEAIVEDPAIPQRRRSAAAWWLSHDAGPVLV